MAQGRKSLVGILGVVLALAAAAPAAAMSRSLCNRGETSGPRPAPAPVLGRVARALGMEEAAVKGGAFYRCRNGEVLVCAVGANLPCGKANTAQSLPAADRYCRAHPGASGVPMAVTGHDTIWSWRCDGPRARAEGPAQKVDGAGYFSDYWKPF